MNYRETSDFLCKHVPMFQSVGKAGYKADLYNTHYLDELFGHPHRNFKTIHIAGTNGKGSVSSMIASVLTEAGYKTGLYTSPHLIDFRERIRINGAMIPEQEVVDFVASCIPIIEKIKPTFFELTTALAFLYFAKEKIDVAIIETGMGGRLDCTNIITPEISVITNIALDHVEFLGDTLLKIAGEKAGIIKKGIPVIIGERHPETDIVFEEKARQCGSEIVFAEDLVICEHVSPPPPSRHSELVSESLLHTYSLKTESSETEISCTLTGIYQTKNICTTFAALEILKHKFDIKESAIKSGFEKVKENSGIMGRWEVLGHNPLVVCDTGHNPHGIKEVARQIESCTYKDLYMVIGMVNDKDITAILQLLPKDAYYIFTKADIPRAMEAGVLAERAMNIKDEVKDEDEDKVKAEVKVKDAAPLISTLISTSTGLKGEIIPDVYKAYQKALSLAGTEDMVFVGGSTFVVADLLRQIG